MKAKQKPATTLPWHTEECSNGGTLVVRQNDRAQQLQVWPIEDAAYIVHACNHYPEMVEMLWTIAGYTGEGETRKAVNALLTRLGETTA
jgi:hypothetical protein